MQNLIFQILCNVVFVWWLETENIVTAFIMYTLTEVLGKGAYAKVFKGFRQDNPNEVVAFKKMHIAAKDYEQVWEMEISWIFDIIKYIEMLFASCKVS